MATTWKLESASKITKHTQKTGLKKNNKINHVLTDKRLQHLEWKKKKSECYLESNGNKNVYVVGKKKKRHVPFLYINISNWLTTHKQNQPYTL